MHKISFKQPSEHGHCKIVCEHSARRICKGAKYQFQIIEKRKEMRGLKEKKWIFPSFSKEKS